MSSPVPPGIAHPHTGVPVLLAGGPCNGTLRYLKPSVASAGRLTCRGATYVPDPKDTNWPPKEPYTTERWVPIWIAAASGGRQPKATKNVSGAWSHLLRVFIHTAPAQIKRQRAATARLDRLAYKARRRHR